MRFFHLLFFIWLLSVDAQRRSVKSELLSENEPPSRSARRGRARFTVSSEAPQIEEHTRSHPARRLPARRRPEIQTEAPIKKGYEVDEVVDDVPIETFRRAGKVRVLTETNFEAHNAPSSNALFQPSTTESLEEIIKSIGSDVIDTTSSSILTSSTVSSNLESTLSDLTSSELSKLENDIGRTHIETTTPITTKTTKRSNGRSRSQSAVSHPTVASRIRTRTNVRRVAEPSTTPGSTRTVNRGSRRRSEANIESRRAPVETVSVPTRSRSFESRSRTSAESVEQPTRVRVTERRRGSSIPSSAESAEVASESTEHLTRSRGSERKRGPSVIASAESVELPVRSRSGRKITTASRRIDEVPEKITIDIPHSRRSSSRRIETTTVKNRSRSRVREIPPVIDEQKLEVLPLFENEPKTVKPVRSFVSRRRNFNSAEEVETSATENDIKFVPKSPKESVIVSVETRTESSIKRRKLTNKPSRSSKATTKATKPTVKSTKPTVPNTRPTLPKTKPTLLNTKPTIHSTKPTVPTSKPTISKPVVKESVISEITEVTSKRTITRSKIGSNSKTDPPKFVPRGAKKSEINLNNVKKNKSGLTSSEEEIEDSDNYPEPFKALIQAKKHKKESRSSHRTVTPAVTKSTEKVATSSSTTTQATTSEANHQLEDSENELDPSKTVQTTRRRLSQTERSSRKSKVARSTTAAPKEHRFHAKFNTEDEVTNNPVKSRAFSPKPRGVYSSRKTKESSIKNKSTTVQIPAQKKSSRYSSRYRNDASTRSAIRTSTNAPAYLPTIPTVTPRTSVKSPVAYQDKDLGVEVISFDDPVNTVPSANLVSGEYLASSTENHLNPLVSASQTKTTEKPVSIIERIINSITAISTTEVPDLTKPTTSSQETLTKESAILKLATKKPTRLDKTQTQPIPTVTVTSENPTTIIERILSSLSAIQADNTTDTKHFKSKQVGTNFNTISSPSTTPLSRVTKSTLTAPYSTSVNPLYLLDEIQNDQTLQKRTIDKLLALLNTMTSPSPYSTPLVVVTPKTTSYVVGTSAATTTTTEPTTTESTTTPPTTSTTPTTTSQLFTSPNPNVGLSSRANIPQTTGIRYTTTPTDTTLNTQTPTPTTQSLDSVSTTPASPTEISNEIGPNPLSIDSIATALPEFETSTDSSTVSTANVGTDSTTPSSISSLSTTEFNIDPETNFIFPSTIPALINFEVEQNTIPPPQANPLSLSNVNNTGSAVQTNQLSISSVSNSTTQSSTSTSSSSAAPTMTPGTTTSSTAPTATLPTLTEILNGRTVKAFNSIINISDLSKVQTLDVDPKTNKVLNAEELKRKNGIVFPVTSPTYTFENIQANATTTTVPSPTLSNRILDDPTTVPPTTTPTAVPPITTTKATTTTTRMTTTAPTTTIPTTTPVPTTTTFFPSTPPTLDFTRGTTVLPLSQPVTSASYRTTTNFPSTTFFPTFLTTLFSTLRPRRLSTEAPVAIVTPLSNRAPPTTTPRVEINTRGGDLITASSTRRIATTTVLPRRAATTTTVPPTTTILTTLPDTTTFRSTRRSGIITTTEILTSTAVRNVRRSTTERTTITEIPTTKAVRNARRRTTEPVETTTSATKKLRELTEQQKKDLATLAQLEMEQASILKQLAFLTNLNFANTKPTTDKSNLANRIIALAVEQDKGREKTTTPPSESSTESHRKGKKISTSNDQALEELVKQLNIATPSTITTQYGSSNDAIIAALLKEQGIGPTTPKVLEDIYSLTTTTTKKPKPKTTTTPRPGPLMQSLNWLLNVLAPPTTTTTKRPKPKPKSKPKPKPKPEKPEELLTHLPTHITPLVTPAPRQNIVSSLSQEDIQKLIKQLETLQKDPNSSEGLDFSSIKSLQNLLESEEGVKVTSSGSSGTTTRETTAPTTTKKRKSKARVVKSTTATPVSVSNSIDEEEILTTTTRSRISLPPVRLRPVPGIEESDTMVRGQLITAAVNVTRAISSFLGTALQDAAQQFTRLFASGSSNLRNYFGPSSVLSNIANVSATS